MMMMSDSGQFDMRHKSLCVITHARVAAVETGTCVVGRSVDHTRRETWWPLPPPPPLLPTTLHQLMVSLQF